LTKRGATGRIPAPETNKTGARQEYLPRNFQS